MEIIQNRMKKTISIILLMVLLLSVTFPVFAATYTGSISKGDKLKFTGNSWTIYKTETAAKNLDKNNTNGTLKNGQQITVQAKNGNVLQIGTNKYIYYGSTGSKNFTKLTATNNTPAKTETKVDEPSGSGLLEIGGAVIGGILDVATSETTMNILSSIKDIIFGIIRTIIESIGNIGNASFDFPKTELPVVDVPSTSTEKILKLNNTKATLEVGKTLNLKATVDGKEVKPLYGSAKGSVATVDENGKITAKSAGTAEINAYYTYKDGLKNVDLKATCTVTVKAKDEKPSSGGNTSSSENGEQSIYLTNYKATDDNNGNYGTAYAGVLLRKDSNGRIGIVHENVYTNSKGWYVYRSGGVDYVILARLKNKSGSYCGFEAKEIVKFKYKGTTYKGVILDCGGATRDLPTLDIYRTMDCTDYPSLEKSTATGTNTYLTITTNFNASKYNEIKRYK